MKDTDSATAKKTIAHGALLPIAALGRFILDAGYSFFSTLGAITLLLGRVSCAIAKGLLLPRQHLGREALFFQMVRVGVRAIPIVILVQMAIGMILPLQMFPKLNEFGQGNEIASINAIAGFRELGPLMTAIVLCGFAGASIVAELGTMVTAEEIEALRASALNPINFLVVSRLLATVVMMVMLTVIADVVLVASGMLTGMKLGISPHTYFQLTIEAVNVTGFITGLVKAGVFGLLIGLIACSLGLSVKPWEGSEGVGRATTNAVVYCIIAIIVTDAIFTAIFYAYGLFN
jgi:phospholipid/cholesterol/gamma-HCH transport system permease protein